MFGSHSEQNFFLYNRITNNNNYQYLGFDDELRPQETPINILQARPKYHPPTSRMTFEESLDETLKRNLEESLTRTLTINNKTENRRIGWIITAVIASSIALGSIGYNWIIPYFTKKQPEILQKEPEIIYGIH